MGVFDDKKFEQLDWISQATEPIDSQMNDFLGKIPDVVKIDFQLYKKIANFGPDISIGQIILSMKEKYAPYSELSYGQVSVLDKCFKLEFSTNEIIIDFENEIISGGEITLIKLNSTMDEKILENILGQEGIESLHPSIMHGSTDSLSRANEIMELLGNCENGLKTRSDRKKRGAILNRLNDLFKNNEWNIRDTELANKVGYWIRDYIMDGNLAAFSNFCRLKVMTHKNQPIYSMEEVQ